MPVQKTDAFTAEIAWSDAENVAMDEQSFHALYDATARPILAYLTGVTGRRDVADDLLQETYCRFLTRQRAMSGEDGSRKYLFRIATNLLRDRWRRGEDKQWTESAAEGFAPDVDKQIDVRSAMQRLKPRERELLWLAYVEGMSHAEIAEAMGLSAMSVRLLLFRARRRAAALLRPREEIR